MTRAPDRGWRAVFFDLDGTLADTVPLILACYRHTMETHFGERLPDERWLATIGRPLEDSFRAFSADPDTCEAMLRTYVGFQRTVHDEMVRPFPGSADLVAGLVSAGIPLAVVTSKRREMALRTLARCGLDGHFELLVTPEDVRRGKPDPEPVLRALEHFGLRGAGDEVLFVGDSPYDVAAGRGAGVRTAGVTWGPFTRAQLEAEGPDYLVDSLDQLRALTG